MIKISNQYSLEDKEVEITFIRAQGKGGQNVNKVSSAVHLRFSIPQSSLPEPLKEKLLARSDQRLTKEGTLVIKAQEFRTQEQNREEALSRLVQFIRASLVTAKKRRPTKATYGSRQRRREQKSRKSQIKQNRKKVDY